MTARRRRDQSAIRGLRVVLLAALAACAHGDGDRPGGAPGALQATADRDGVQARLELAPARPTLTDPVTLTLTVTAPLDRAVRMPAFTDRLGDFVVRGFSEPPDEQQGDQLVRRQEYRLEPTGAGSQFLPPLPVELPGPEPAGHVLVTDPLEVEVGTLSGADAPRLSDLPPAEDAVPLAPAAGPVRWAPWVGGAVLLLVAVLWWRRRRRTGLPAEPRLSPRELAEREFAALRAEDPLGRGDVKTWYVELTAIVRRYIERTDGIRAPELTTPEFLRALQMAGEVPPERRQALGAFLEAADLVKFAAHRPGRADIDGSERRARELVGLGRDAAAERAA